MPIDPAEQELWLRYRRNGDGEARDYLFMCYTSWARKVAASVYRRLRVHQVEWNDYVQNAQVGLLEAMSRFDVARGTDFMAYAKPRVRGAVFNGLRAILREEQQSRNLLGARLERLQSLSDEPASEPLTDFVDSVIGLGLGHLLENEQFGAATGHAQGMAEQHELGVLLKDALLELRQRDRSILMAHYFQQIPFQDVAIEHGITKGRVSQIHKAALMRLREALAKRRCDFQSL